MRPIRQQLNQTAAGKASGTGAPLVPAVSWAVDLPAVGVVPERSSPGTWAWIRELWTSRGTCLEFGARGSGVNGLRLVPTIVVGLAPPPARRLRHAVPAFARASSGPSGRTGSTKLNTTASFVWAFDLLELDGADLRALRQERRKERLKVVLNRAPFGLALNDYVAGNGPVLFARGPRNGPLRASSRSAGARPIGRAASPHWLKAKSLESRRCGARHLRTGAGGGGERRARHHRGARLDGTF